MAKAGGGGGRGGGGGGLSSAERVSPVSRVPSGQWINFRHGKERWGVNFSGVEKDASGDAVRSYSWSKRQGSRRTGGSGVIRLRDNQGFDYMDRSGNLKTPLDVSKIVSGVSG